MRSFSWRKSFSSVSAWLSDSWMPSNSLLMNSMVFSETRFFFSKPRLTYSVISRLTNSTIFLLSVPFITMEATEACLLMGLTVKVLICLTRDG